MCDLPSIRLMRGLGLSEAVWAAVPGDGLSMPQAAQDLHCFLRSSGL